MNCVFCQIARDNVLVENEYFIAVRDIHPVAPGHCLIIARRHVASFFELSQEEMVSLHDLASLLKTKLDQEYAPDGYNLGMNCGAAAGQSVFHFHMHVIPRYGGDRKALQGMREYLKKIL
jgi:diadenosine tetraphosphate (Ap4A) HIT family hydrolase